MGSGGDAARIKFTALARMSSLIGIHLGLGIQAESDASGGDTAGTRNFSAPVPGLFVAQLRRISSNWNDSMNY